MPRWTEDNLTKSSPRKRGCFLNEGCPSPGLSVFPAQAGVFLCPRSLRKVISSLPRASGGVSKSSTLAKVGVWSSPRKRGCFSKRGASDDETRRSSPRKRGCFSSRSGFSEKTRVFPAQAGVFPQHADLRKIGHGLPRASGGVSVPLDKALAGRGSSPRKRGCFCGPKWRRGSRVVFPAQAGVFPVSALPNVPEDCLPRASGGVSSIRDSSYQVLKVFPAQAGVFPTFDSGYLVPFCLPRASGGVSSQTTDVTPQGNVFPAQAGVFPTFDSGYLVPFCLPRASGGVSSQTTDVTPQGNVFPAQAGVFPRSEVRPRATGGLPRASGGVSGWARSGNLRSQSSPRKRGGFSAFACAPLDVFGLPRASGGVSRRCARKLTKSRSSPRKRGCFLLPNEPCGVGRESSPRKRGCFQARNPEGVIHMVFPAQAGVFPIPSASFALRVCLPRASGGVSLFRSTSRADERSSPRKRGCFLGMNQGRSARLVFPAQAGVFPKITESGYLLHSLPRASGGVSLSFASRIFSPLSSPRKRGCFYLWFGSADCRPVFPAQAGVFPR